MKKKQHRNDEMTEDLQSELARLKRQFILLEDDKRVYKEETKHELREQTETIESLKLEYNELAKEYKLAVSLQNQKVDDEDTRVLQQLLRDEEETKKAITKTNKTIGKLNKNIRTISNKIEKQRKLMGGVKESERRFKEIIKLKSVMENRLNAASVKFNRGLSQNAKIRSGIEHINAQRRKFEDFRRKLSKLFNKGKEEKDFLIEKATSLFHSRDEAQHRMQSLTERSEKDLLAFNTELKELLRVIDHDRILREFMKTKTEEREELFGKVVGQREKRKLCDFTKGLSNQIEHYETIFDRLGEVSKARNIDEMVKTFIEIEDQNFASFNFIKEQSCMIQQQESDIKGLQQTIEQMGKEEHHFGKKHREIMNELHQVQQTQQTESYKVVNQLKTDKNILEKICIIFDRIVLALKCQRKGLVESLSDSKSISIDNLTLFMGLIEQRANEFLQAESFLAHKSNAERSTLQSPKKISFQTAGRIVKSLLLPKQVLPDLSDGIANDAIVDEENVRPLSQNEIRAAATQATLKICKLNFGLFNKTK